MNSIDMWIIQEIRTEMLLGRTKEILSKAEIIKKCEESKVDMRSCFGSDNTFLGYCISDKDCKELFGLY